MNEKLKKELEIQKEYELKYIPHTKLIELSLENVQKVETMLRYNPDYPQFVDVKVYKDAKVIIDIQKKIATEYSKYDEHKKDFKFQYPSVFYILALKQDKEEGKLKEDLYKYYITAILRRINAENHTHTSIEDINDIASKVCKKYKNCEMLLKALKEPLNKNCQYELISCIASSVNNRHNFSLATKFCHYLNFYIYLDTEYADLFSIYDEIVKDNLHLYYNYYCVSEELEDLNQPIPDCHYKYKSEDLKKFSDAEATKKLIEVYKNYQYIIGKIINKCGISRNGFDHLIWYTGK